MKVGKIKDHPWMPLYCIPFIGGTVIASVVFLLKVFREIYRQFMEDSGKTYEVTTTYYDVPGFPKVMKQNHTGGGSTFIFFLVALYAVIASWSLFVDASTYLLKSPYIFLLPFYIMGASTVFYRDEIIKWAIEQNVKATNTFHFILMGVASIFVAYNILDGQLTSEINARGDKPLLLLPFSVMVFGGFMAPLSIALTMIRAGYRSAYRQHGAKGLIMNPLNLAFVLSLPLTMLYYYSTTDNDPIALLYGWALNVVDTARTISAVLL